jgi:hypothetical protein
MWKFHRVVKKSVSSDEEENVGDYSSMQHGIWAKSGGEWPCFPFTGKHFLNVDLQDPSNSLEYFELLCTPEIVVVIARETNWYTHKSLENALSKTKI